VKSARTPSAVRAAALGLACLSWGACQDPEKFYRSSASEIVLDAGALDVAALPVVAPAVADPTPLPVAGGADPCSRRNWTFAAKFRCDTAACQDVPASAKNPFNAIDGMPDTRYTTGRSQGSAGPETVTLQLPRRASLTGLTLLTTSGDGPATYLVERSADGVAFEGFQPPVFGAGSETTAISFPATALLAVRVTQTGVKAANWWSINELDVVGCLPQ
jgi:hypothetical protein